jgi:hypothetical protein
MSGSLLCCLLFILLSASSVTCAGVFDLEEIQVAPSPAQEKHLQLKLTEKVLDFDAAKDGPETAGGGQKLPRLFPVNRYASSRPSVHLD